VEDGQHVSSCLMQPGQHEHLHADSKVVDAFRHLGRKHLPGVQYSFNSLLCAVPGSTRGDSTDPIGRIVEDGVIASAS